MHRNLEGVIAGQIVQIGRVGEQQRLDAPLAHPTTHLEAAPFELIRRKRQLASLSGRGEGMTIGPMIHGCSPGNGSSPRNSLA